MVAGRVHSEICEANMTGKSNEQPNRREFLRVSMLSSGALLLDLGMLDAAEKNPNSVSGPFQDGKHLGVLEFVGESRAPLDTLIGTGLDARLYSDLSALTPEKPVNPAEKFYVRTRASELLETEKAWVIKVGGIANKPMNLNLDDLTRRAKLMGRHLMECSGNARATRFGLISVADWSGVPISEVLEAVSHSRTNRVMISGLDQYPTRSVTSIPGADWIFTLEELQSAKAFLATGMNGHPLSKDHGAPVRLVVPGWYGCTCIKWVNAITFVDDTVDATSQMQEFAARTHQQGVPGLAREYKPAIIDQAAMPVRVEKWLVSGKIKYRVVGILWGGSRPIEMLQIRFNPEEDYVPVDSFSQTANDPWSFWSHSWMPKVAGTYMIRLRVTDPVVQTKRLDSGYYVRSVEVTEV